MSGGEAEMVKGQMLGRTASWIMMEGGRKGEAHGRCDGAQKIESCHHQSRPGLLPHARFSWHGQLHSMLAPLLIRQDPPLVTTVWSGHTENERFDLLMAGSCVPGQIVGAYKSESGRNGPMVGGDGDVNYGSPRRQRGWPCLIGWQRDVGNEAHGAGLRGSSSYRKIA